MTERLVTAPEGYFRLCPKTGRVLEVRAPRPGLPGSAIREAGVIYATASTRMTCPAAPEPADTPMPPRRAHSRRRRLFQFFARG